MIATSPDCRMSRGLVWPVCDLGFGRQDRTAGAPGPAARPLFVRLSSCRLQPWASHGLEKIQHARPRNLTGTRNTTRKRAPPPTRVTGLAGTRMRRRRRARARAGPPTCDDPRDRWIGFGRRPRRAAPRDVRPGEYANSRRLGPCAYRLPRSPERGYLHSYRRN